MKKFLYSFAFLLLLLNTKAQDWTWIHGGNLINTYGFYGNKGVSSPTVIPGTRHGCCTWTDASGNLWLFGGEGLGASFFSGWLNDMWKFNVTTNEWTWIKGDSVVNKIGIYGTQGVSSPTNNPGGREFALTWTDASGNFWMYGGDGWSSGAFGNLNDLWKYNPSTNEWTWMKGSNINNQTGIYGSIGVSSASNLPGGRYSAAHWSDAAGNLWMFGGFGYPASGGNGNLNDLWKYNPTTNQWTWINGSNLIAQNGTYGTMGVAASANNPGGREFISSWGDAFGNMWLFGGYGMPASGPVGYLNDIWKYNPTTNQWTWMNGANIINQNGMYGPLGVSSPVTMPGSREAGATWVDKGGNFWLSGGFGYPDFGGIGRLNDLFKYNPATNEYTYMKGATIVNQYGTYGTKGVSSPLNTPGARYYTNTWTGSNGSLYMWGGFSFPVSGAPGNMNEMWRFIAPCNVESMSSASQTNLCNGNSTTLSAVTSSTGAVNWYTSPTSTTSIGTGTNLTVGTLTTGASPSTYTFFAEVGTCTLSPARIPVVVTVNPLPIVTASAPTVAVCSGSTGCLSANGASTYQWAGPCGFNSNLQSPCFPFYLICGCNYSVTGIDANGCSNSSTVCILVNPSPNVSVLTSNTLICAGQTATLTANGANTYSWSTSATGSVIAVSPTVTAGYTVTGTASNGCSSVASITQSVSACVGITEIISVFGETTVYPNPNNGKFEITNPSANSVLYICNLLGEEILKQDLTENKTDIDISGISKSIYLYKIIAKNKLVGVGKITVE